MAEKHAVEFGVIGLGQAGGCLAAEFARLGYPGLALNTSEPDLASLSGLEEDRKILLEVPGGKPVSRGAELGSEALKNSADHVRSQIRDKLAGCGAFLVCAGLGGATGGAAGELVRLAASLGRPVAVLGVLPWKSESHTVKATALQAINDVLDSDFAALLLVDGQKLLERYASASLASFLTEADGQVAKLVDELNSLARNAEYKSIRTFDPASFHQVFFSGGISILGRAEPQGSLGKEGLLSAVEQVVSDNALFAGPLDLGEALTLAAVVVAPEEDLAKVPAGDFDAFWQALKDKTSGAAIHSGIYEGGTAATVFVVAGGLPLPGRVEALLEEATEEAARFSTKKEAKRRLRKLDLSGLGGVVGVSRAAPPETPAKGMAKAEEKPAAEDSTPPAEETVVEEEVVEEEEVLDLEGEWDEDEE